MSTASTLGFALVGTGSIADFHARALALVPGTRLCAVASRDPAKAAAFAAQHATVAEQRLEGLLARSDVDVVVIASPSGTHGEIALAALAAGKHVLCEKPLEISTERIDALNAAAARAQRVLAVVLPSRLGDGATAVKRAVAAGRLGRLTLGTAEVKWWRTDAYYRSSAWRGTWQLDGGGALMNQGIHAVDLLIWLAGMPKSVTAVAGTLAHPGIEVEDTLVAALQFEHGGLGTIACATSCAPGAARRIELGGTRGSITLEDDRITRWALDESRPEDAAILAGAGASALGGGGSDPRAIGLEGHRRVLADLVHALRTGQPPAVDGREGRRSVAVIEAIYAAARSGAAVSPR